MEPSFLTRDQALSLWRRGTDSKTLDYQRTNPAAAAAKSPQSCPTLCNPTEGSPTGSPVPGILQARTLESVAISFFNAWRWKVKVKSLSRVQLLATSCTAAYQAPPSMGFSRQEYWSGVPLPSPHMLAPEPNSKEVGWSETSRNRGRTSISFLQDALLLFMQPKIVPAF